MPEINYQEFNTFLEGVSGNDFAPVVLIHGEEYLCKSIFDKLLERLIPQSKRSLHYEPSDEDTESIFDIVERLNTFSLLPGMKVVSMCESRIFHSGKDGAAILEKVKADFDRDEKKKAAKNLASLLSVFGLSFEEVQSEKGKETIRYSESFSDDGKWFDELAGYSISSGVKIPDSGDSSKILKDAIEKGFPDNHHLIITVDLVDKRKGLYDVIKKTGVIIDCSVPKGVRKADKDQQASVLRESADRVLAGSGKRLAPDALNALSDMTGFDLRTFAANLEKLVSYVGERDLISGKDVRTLINRTKQDPIFELSGAVAERNLENALFFSQTLLKNSVFPLQILATVVNQIRRLMLAKSFISSLPAGVWNRGADYNYFRNTVMPHVKEYDKAIKDRITQRETLYTKPPQSGKKSKKKKAATDLVIAKNPNSPYPVFLLVKNADRYSLDELYDSFELLSSADRRLKSTGEDPKIILDHTLIQICSGRSTG